MNRRFLTCAAAIAALITGGVAFHALAVHVDNENDKTAKLPEPLARLDTAARHDLLWNGPEYFKLKWDGPYRQAATSFVRAVARTSSRFATFAQAISKTTPTTPSSNNSR